MSTHALSGDDLRWWGQKDRRVAHHFVDTMAEESACRRNFALDGNWTRLDIETGKPWPRCKNCVASLRKEAADG